jgi:SAM-dependent methyltransferase
LRGYIKGKLRGDPVFAAAVEAVGRLSLPVVDLGCGLGLFGLWLRAHGHGFPYRGCDLGGWKITAGNRAAGRLGFTDFALEEADMCSFPLEGPAVVCTFDVIHYLPVPVQHSFAARLADAARNGSVVLMRTGVRGCGWRTGATLVEEGWTRATGWIRGGRVNFPQLGALVRVFENEGCLVECRPLWGRTPFSSHWLEVSARV